MKTQIVKRKTTGNRDVQAIDLLLSEARLNWMKAVCSNDKRIAMIKINELLDERQVFTKGASKN